MCTRNVVFVCNDDDDAKEDGMVWFNAPFSPCCTVEPVLRSATFATVNVPCLPLASRSVSAYAAADAMWESVQMCTVSVFDGDGATCFLVVRECVCMCCGPNMCAMRRFPLGSVADRFWVCVCVCVWVVVGYAKGHGWNWEHAEHTRLLKRASLGRDDGVYTEQARTRDETQTGATATNDDCNHNDE